MHDSNHFEVHQHLLVNTTIVQENGLLGNFRGVNIFLEQNEKSACICEEFCFHIEASSQDQRAHKECHHRLFTFVKDKKC